MDLTLKIKADGKAAVDDLKKVVSSMSAAEASAKREAAAAQQIVRWRNERAKLARAERDAAFDQLSVEEKLVRLQQRKADIARRLAATNVSDRRREALLASQALVDSQMRGLGPVPPGGALGGLRGALGGLGRFAGVAGLAGAAFTGLQGGKQIVRDAGAISDSAGRMGIDAESQQEFAAAAGKSGASIGALEGAFKKLQLAQVRAINGNEDSEEAFKRLGLSLKDLQTSSPEEIFRKIAKNAEGLPQSAEVLSDLTRVLGQSADDLLPAFKNGFSEAAQQAREAGAIIENDLIEQLDDAGDTMELLAARSKAAFAPVVANIASVFSGLMVRMATTKLFIEEFLGAYSSGGVSASQALQQAQDAAEKVRSAFEQKDKAKSTTGSDPVEDRERLKQIEELRKKNQAEMAEMAFEELGTQEKINKLLADRLKLQQQIVGEKDALKREELVAEELKLSQQLKGLKKPGAGGGGVGALAAVDQLARIGLVRGGADQTRVHLQRQIQILTKQESLLRQILKECK